MLRWIKGVTLRNIRENENVEVDKEQGERNENVEVGGDTTGQRERGMRMLRWIKGVTLRDREREE